MVEVATLQACALLFVLVAFKCGMLFISEQLITGHIADFVAAGKPAL